MLSVGCVGPTRLWRLGFYNEGVINAQLIAKVVQSANILHSVLCKILNDTIKTIKE